MSAHTASKPESARLLAHLRKLTTRPVLIGTWAHASWAIRFYQKHGFHLVIPEGEKNRLLHTYWNIPEAQVAVSVVLADRETSTLSDSSANG